jgi:hypothetical protein
VILSERVFAGGRSKRFAELTRADVEARAQQLAKVSARGPAARVRPVAVEWAALARSMADQGAEHVADLATEELAERAPRLWLVPPRLAYPP